MKSKKMHSVSHVHWDPVWYSSYQEYGMRLHRLMKKLLRILKDNQNYPYFMLDGQIEMVELYLEMEPQDRDEIIGHVKSGRLKIGPWYNQPEQFSLSGESLIRNLKRGMEMAAELGGHMKISYLCDPVGHIAQMPQIVKGFGLDYYFAMRGAMDGEEIKNSEYFWEAPDGSRVLMKTMSYNSNMPIGQEEFDAYIDESREYLNGFSASDSLLFMQGHDHKEPDEKFIELMNNYNKTKGEEIIVPTTLEQHMETVSKSASSLKTYTGEMRKAYQAPMLTGIISTRMNIKLKNARVERGLEKYLEPLCSLNWALGGEYPGKWIDLAWKFHTKNNFHDSIYGAHADHVTDEVMHCYKQAEEHIVWHTNEALHNIAVRTPDVGMGKITCFNPLPRERKHIVADAEFLCESVAQAHKMNIYDSTGRPVMFQINKIEQTDAVIGSGNLDQFIIESRIKVGVSILLNSIPALGYKTLYVKEGNDRAEGSSLTIESDRCENEYLSVKLYGNGMADIVDKETGELYQGMNFFEDMGDAGDQYTFSPTYPPMIYNTLGLGGNLSIHEKGPLKAVYKAELDFALPEGLDAGSKARSKNMITNRITVYITLRAKSRIVEFHTVLDNQSRSHKITVGFNTGVSADKAASGSQFFVNERTAPSKDYPSWIDNPMGFLPHKQFVSVCKGDRGFTLLDRGLTEYKYDGGGLLYETLLRCNEFLSLEDLPERSYNHAGPKLRTPGAQCIGVHEYDYAVYTHNKDWRGGGSHIAAEEWNAPVVCRYIDSTGGEKTLPEEYGLMSVDNCAAMISAIKKGMDDELVVRLYNTSPEKTVCRLSFSLPVESAWTTDFLENKLEALNCDGGVISLEMQSYKIITLAIAIKR